MGADAAIPMHTATSVRARSSTDVPVQHELVLITTPGCHLCEEARLALEELRQAFRLTVREIHPLDGEGIAIVERYRTAMWPVVILDGTLFSAGRLPSLKLRRLLEREVERS